MLVQYQVNVLVARSPRSFVYQHTVATARSLFIGFFDLAAFRTSDSWAIKLNIDVNISCRVLRFLSLKIFLSAQTFTRHSEVNMYFWSEASLKIINSFKYSIIYWFMGPSFKSGVHILQTVPSKPLQSMSLLLVITIIC